jgi:hypothetical protein
MARARATLLEGTEVIVKGGSRLDKGRWKVISRVSYSGRRDPAYDLVNVSDGRRRVLRASRLALADADRS